MFCNKMSDFTTQIGYTVTQIPLEPNSHNLA